MKVPPVPTPNRRTKQNRERFILVARHAAGGHVRTGGEKDALRDLGRLLLKSEEFDRVTICSDERGTLKNPARPVVEDGQGA